MKTIYIAQHGCYVSLKKEQLLVKQGSEVLQAVQLPAIEQVLVLGKSQLTTQLICACLERDIPIAYLSKMGRCYGRVLSVARGYRQLARLQRDLSPERRLGIARRLIWAKLRNSRTILQRQQRRRLLEGLRGPMERLEGLAGQVLRAGSLEQLLGYEGAGAAAYFGALGLCFEVEPGVRSLRWDLVNRQVRVFRDCVIHGSKAFTSYQIR